MYRSAILGCGGRSRGHVNAYAHVKNGQVTAACEMDEKRLNSFCDQFDIESRYTDLHEMLEKEKPDLLHIVTRPSLRVPLMTMVSEHQVPAAIVEKPVAVDGEDYLALLELSQTTTTKFAINHQLHFHPKRLELEQAVREGRIGEVRLLESSARLNLLGQGTHVLELMFAFNNYVKPISVFGQVSGGSQLDSTHPAPDMAEAAIIFEDGSRGVLLCGSNAPVIPGAVSSHHKRIAVYGTRGFVEWQMNAWELGTPDGYESGDKSYGAEDVLGQAGLTDAAFDWIADDSKLHPTRLELSLEQYNVILGLYASSLERKIIELPHTPDGNCLDGLREALA